MNRRSFPTVLTCLLAVALSSCGKSKRSPEGRSEESDFNVSVRGSDVAPPPLSLYDRLANALALPSGSREQEIKSLYADLYLTHPQSISEMLEWLERNSPDQFRAALSGIVTTAGDVSEALTLIDKFSTGRPRNDLALLVVRTHTSVALNQNDPGRLEKLALSLDQLPTGARLESVERLSAAWGKLSPRSALAWARSLPFLEERDKALREIAKSIPHDSDQALDALKGLLESENRPEDEAIVARQLGRVLMERDLNEAVKWLKDNSDKSYIDQPFLDVVTKSAKLDFREAENLLALAATDELRRAGALRIGVEYAKSAPDVAANWIMSLSDAYYSDDALRSVLWAWYQQDASQLANWLSERSTGRPRAERAKRYWNQFVDK